MRVGAKENTRAVPFGGRDCNPESRANISGEQDDGVKVAARNELPNPWIDKAEERTYAGNPGAVRQARPRITLQKRNVPFHLDPETRIEIREGALQAAIRHLDIDPRVSRQ